MNPTLKVLQFVTMRKMLAGSTAPSPKMAWATGMPRKPVLVQMVMSR